MPTSVIIRDVTNLKHLTPTENKTEFILELLEERITVRELIRSRVYQEVQEYNAKQSGNFRGLVAPSAAVQEAEGYRLSPNRKIDWAEQFANAIDAFERNGFLILVDGEQVGGIDEMVELKTGSAVSFLKLVPLVGG